PRPSIGLIRKREGPGRAAWIAGGWNVPRTKDSRSLGRKIMDLNAGSQLDAVEREDEARRHLLSPAEDMAKLGQETRPLLAYGEGIHLVDSRGRRLIDGPAGMWCTQVGYGRNEIVQAIAEQAMRLSYNSPWYTINSPAAALSAKIA